MSSSDEPQRFPTEIIVGETLEWERDFDDYPADEWTVTYYVRGKNGPGFDALGVADGTTHTFDVTATTTGSLVAGRYDYQAIAVKDAEKFIVDEGRAIVRASLAAINANATYDGQSTAKKIVDAIDALMLGKASLDQQEYMIGTAGSQRMLKRILIPELIELRRYYARIVRRENGKGREFQTVFAQFDAP